MTAGKRAEGAACGPFNLSPDQRSRRQEAKASVAYGEIVFFVICITTFSSVFA
jgi:hypothetical protein